MPKVSVVMPAYDSGRYIAESVKSALDQSYKDVELIVIDDGSTDDTAAVVRTSALDSRLVYIKSENRGLSAARNLGIESARGELIAFLDSDDIFKKDKIFKQVECLQKNPACGICYTNMTYFNSETKEEMLSTYYHFSGDIFYFLKKNNFIHPSSVVVRKNILRDNLFDESLRSHEDWDFFLRLAMKGVNFCYIKEPLTEVRLRAESMTLDTAKMDATRVVVGLKAKGYWKVFKKDMNLISVNGLKAIGRYLNFKIAAFFMGFPYRKCFNRPLPNEILWKK